MIRRTIISLACALMMTVSKAAAEDPWDTLTFEKLDRVAEAALGNAQDLSLENNREYCGYIAFDGEERLCFTAPLKGSVETCTPPEVPDDWELIASYHTHGALNPNEPDVSYELPSSDDIRSDVSEGIDGYLSTPGDRFWFIDTEDEIVIMLGGVGYFQPDNFFEQDLPCGPRAQHTFDEIYLMEDEDLAPCDL